MSNIKPVYGQLVEIAGDILYKRYPSPTRHIVERPYTWERRLNGDYLKAMLQATYREEEGYKITKAVMIAEDDSFRLEAKLEPGCEDIINNDPLSGFVLDAFLAFRNSPAFDEITPEPLMGRQLSDFELNNMQP
jgi:hypothetical protein